MSELKHVYSLKGIFTTAWTLARRGARQFGGKARAYFARALSSTLAIRGMLSFHAGSMARVCGQ